MLIVPFVPTTLAVTLGWALPVGALPTGSGPFAGAIVVYGSRSALLPPALAHGALLLTSRFQNCGTIRRTINAH